MNKENLPAMADEGFDFCSFIEPLIPLFELIEGIFAFFGTELNILDLLGCGEEEAPE
jgi:hypothetical protein